VQLTPPPLPKTRTATLASSFINLTNTIIGSGMLGLPYAVARCGLAFGIVLLLLRYGAATEFASMVCGTDMSQRLRVLCYRVGLVSLQRRGVHVWPVPLGAVQRHV